jgi:hypothetical protein
MNANPSSDMPAERPFLRSYWARAGALLGGCYPGAVASDEAESKLSGLLRCGVTTIISLMEPNERDHAGKPFVDYDEMILKLAAQSGQRLEIQRQSIVDMSVPSTKRMTGILDTVDESITRGGAVYVHCWGGRGRTGSVIGCHWIRHGLHAPAEVLDHLHRLTAHAKENFWPTPQTDEQRRFVTNWRKGQ